MTSGDGLAVRAEKVRRRDARSSWIITAICFGIVVAILAFTPGALNLGAIGGITLRAPDFAPLAASGVLVQIHVITVAFALMLGPVQFALPKGTQAHRWFGVIWASAMIITAVTTFFIRDMRDGQFSPIHIFSVMTIVGVPSALWLARINAMSHARAMYGLYVGLLIAGVTAIVPGRLIWEMFFS
jgi:uncharacterized membrane protein